MHRFDSRVCSGKHANSLLRALPVMMGILTLGAACAPGNPPATREQSISTPTRPACQPSLIQQSRIGFPEIQGTMHSDGEMWALLFFDEAHAKTDEKIVWRITGEGMQLDAQARNEDGILIRPIWGPENHAGSNWDHPGDEWGTGFNFPDPGCWTITVTRGTTTGEIRLNVLSP